MGISAFGERSWFPLQRRVGFKSKILKVFQKKRCRTERYKDSDHAFLINKLFALMIVWLSAFVLSVSHRLCLTVLLVLRPKRVCFSVFFWVASVRVPVSYIVCELPSLSAQCVQETVVVLCWLGLPCPVLSWFVLRVTNLCCLFVVFALPLVHLRSCVHWLFRSFFLFFVPSFVQGVSCSSFFLTRTQIKLSNLPLKCS